MKQMKLLMGLSLAAALVAMPALADSTASVNTSSSSSGSSSLAATILKNAKASYAFEMYGPTAKALSGNTDGTGTSITINHYAGIGYKIGGKWSVGLTQPFRQNIDEVPQDQIGAKDAFHALDPYVSLNNSRIMGSSRFFNFNLASQLRYYAPLSKATINAKNEGKKDEAGNGTARAVLIPSLSFMDGALELSSATYFYYRFAARTNAEHTTASGADSARNDYYFISTPTVGYQVSKNVQAYLETGMVLKHRTNGRWTKTDDANDGLYFAPGANINVGKKLTLNPYAQVGPYAFDIAKAQFVFVATYVFL